MRCQSSRVVFVELELDLGTPLSEQSLPLPASWSSELQGGETAFCWSVDAALLTRAGIRWKGVSRRLPGAVARLELSWSTGGDAAGAHVEMPARDLLGSGRLEVTLEGYGRVLGTQSLRLELKIFETTVDVARTRVVATRCTNTHRTQFSAPSDVKIFFPATHLELWTSVETLCAVSANYRDLLAPDPLEATTLSMPNPRHELHKWDFDESDDESDSAVVRGLQAFGTRRGSEASTSTAGSTGSRWRAPYRQINMDTVSYTTYHAFLCWLHTGHISFSPLSSTFRFEKDPVRSRSAAMDKTSARNPSFPRPTSPKSIYRLAHLLELPTLMELALESIESQLTVANAAFELFGDLAGTFHDVQDVEMDFVVRHWSSIKSGRAMREVTEAVAGGSMPWYAAVSVELVQRF